ncbi:MAG: TonB-dependent receptor [Acidobacteriota bacterium]
MRACALLLSICLPVAALADDPKLDETIVVTATRSERAVSELPVSTTVIREKDIKAAPVTTVDDLLRTIPGVHMTLISSTGATPNVQRVSMNGLGGKRALVLLDGVPLHDPYSGTVQWQKVPLSNLRQIEVVRGGNASLFGNFALGGTINLLTRRVEDDRVELDTLYGTSATLRTSIGVDQIITPALKLRVTQSDADSNGYYRVPEPGPVDIRTPTDHSSTTGRLDYDPSEGTRMFLRGSVAKIDVSQGTPLTLSNRDVLDGSAGFQRALGTSGLLVSNVYYQRQSERTIASTILGARTSEVLSQDATIPSRVAGASVEWSTQRPGSIAFLSAGVDLQQVEAQEDRLAFSRSGALTQRVQIGGRQRFAAVFGQASWRPSPRIEVLGGARLDHFTNDQGREAIVGGAVTDYPSATSTQLDPRISVRYAIGPRTAVRGSVYRAFSAPTLRDLYRTNQTGTSLILGNPDLEPETLLGGEAGLEWAGARMHVELNLYRSEIEGLASLAHAPGQPANVFRNVNLGTSRSQGVEAMFDARINSQWSVNASYTYADSRVIEDPNPELVGKLIPEVVPHVGSLSIRFRGHDGTSVDVRGRVLSRSYGEPANLVAAPAHRVVDVSLSRPIRSWLDAYAVLENVFDEHYYYVLTPTAFRTAQPRSVSGGVRVRVLTGGRH